MTQPGHDASSPAQEPWAPPAAPVGVGTMPAPESGSAAPASKKGLLRFLPVAGSAAIAVVISVGQTSGWFDGGPPAVGDCVQLTGDTSFEVVDCGEDSAEYTIVGAEQAQMTYDEAVTSPDTCAEFATTEFVLWSGDSESEPGDVYCAAPA